MMVTQATTFDQSRFNTRKLEARMQRFESLRRHQDFITFKNAPEKYLLLPLRCKKSILIPVKDIVYLQAMSNYTEFFLNNGKKIMVSRTMKEFLSKLDAEMFVRVHKSFVINLNYLLHFDVREEMFVQLVGDVKLSVSRRKKKEFLDKRKSYVGR